MLNVRCDFCGMVDYWDLMDEYVAEINPETGEVHKFGKIQAAEKLPRMETKTLLWKALQAPETLTTEEAKLVKKIGDSLIKFLVREWLCDVCLFYPKSRQKRGWMHEKMKRLHDKLYSGRG